MWPAAAPAAFRPCASVAPAARAAAFLAAPASSTPTGSLDCYDPGRCTVVFKVDDREHLRETYGWQDGRSYHYSYQQHLSAGDHRLTFEIEPLTPAEKRKSSVDLRVRSVKMQGPLDPKHWVRSSGYDRFSPGTSRRKRLQTAGYMRGKSWGSSRPRRFGAPWLTARSIGWSRSPKQRTRSRGSLSSKASRGRWWLCWPRRGSCSAWKKPGTTPALRTASILSLMNTPWRHGSRTSSGRQCPIKSFCGWPSAVS